MLDILLQSRRNQAAAKKFFRKLLKKQGFAPRVIVTDKLKSYAAAKKEILPGVEQRQHKGLNNRAENSHDSNSTEREADAKVQVAKTSTTIFLCFRVDPRSLSRQATPTLCL